MWLAAEILFLLAVVAFCVVSDNDGLTIPLAVMTTIAALFVLPVTAGALVSANRLGRILSTYPWQAYPCEFDHASVRAETLIVLKPEPGHQVRMQPRPFKADLSRGDGAASETIWFAGDLRFGGAASPPGGHRPVRTMRHNLRKASRVSHQASAEADALAEQADLTRDGRAKNFWF